jgi:L-fuculose-phosphate aldolase
VDEDRVDEDGAQHVSAADRQELVAFARRMAGDDLAPGTSGNLSVRRQDMIAITPSGVSYERMGAADICLVRVAAGGGRAAAEPSPGAGEEEPPQPGLRPSTETPMHLAVYRATGAGAIVHTHSPFVVALSTVLDELPAVHYAMADLGGIVRVAPYTRFGTPQLAANAVAALSDRNAVILRNHGALACGPDLTRAYDRARTLEWLARVYWYARLAGTPQTLNEAALTEVSDATRELRYGEQTLLAQGDTPMTGPGSDD